jgi:phosphatidate phosphatase APP1
MAQFYQILAARNPDASFHYVSSSPHQLYPALDGFLQENAFPPGSLHLRHIKLTEEVLRKGSSSARHKHQAIRGLLQQFPGRKFVLVGDSGEADPEIYASIAEDYPGQVKAIFIRDVTGEAATLSRYQKAFGKIGSISWYIFTSVDDLPVHFGATD